jgi:hypothetical protein
MNFVFFLVNIQFYRQKIGLNMEIGFWYIAIIVEE